MITYTDAALVTAVKETAPRTGVTPYLICYDGHWHRVRCSRPGVVLRDRLYVRVGAGIEFLDGTTEWMLTGGEPPPPPDLSWFVPHTEPVNHSRLAVTV